MGRNGTGTLAGFRRGAIRVRKILKYKVTEETEIEYKEKMADSTWNVACI